MARKISAVMIGQIVEQKEAERKIKVKVKGAKNGKISKDNHSAVGNIGM